MEANRYRRLFNCQQGQEHGARLLTSSSRHEPWSSFSSAAARLLVKIDVKPGIVSCEVHTNQVGHIIDNSGGIVTRFAGAGGTVKDVDVVVILGEYGLIQEYETGQEIHEPALSRHCADCGQYDQLGS